MRVVHVISGIDPSMGGTAAAVTSLATAQRAAAGIDVAVVTTFTAHSATAAADALRARGVDVTEIGPARGPLQRHPDIWRALDDAIARADVVHVQAVWEEIQYRAAQISRNRAVPYVITPHGMLDPWSLRQSALKKKLYLAWRLRKVLDNAAAVHFTSEIERDVSAPPLRLRAPTIVIPNGIDLAEFDDLPPRGAFRAKHPEIAGRPIVLFLGRVHPKKGFDLLIPALARAAGLENTLLVIAGPEHPGYGQTVRDLAARQGVADRVLMVGMLHGRDRIEAMVDADLFVLPSYQENFGIAVAEALAAGCPVVISDQVNIHPQITAAGAGGVVPTKIEPLAAELARWMGDEPLRRSAGERGRAFVREKYDWPNIARRWADQYRALARKAVA
jgi:glycosyltransferase involved in cell wall biosynthesis